MEKALKEIDIDKKGSVTARLGISKSVPASDERFVPISGDVVAVRALGESTSYGNLELTSGRLAKIKAGDILLGAVGSRRALKGFVGDVPGSIGPGDRLHLLNMGGVVGICSGHHSSLTDAIELEVIGIVVGQGGSPVNIADGALRIERAPLPAAPVILVAGSCMNSGKTVAATELIKQAAKSGMRVAGVKLSGIACLRDTLQMEDSGAFVTASFLDCGLPSTVGRADLAAVASTLFHHVDTFGPDLIIAELGDGIVGGYSVESILADKTIMNAIASVVFCASDYVGVIGGAAVLREFGISIDAVAGSVTDAPMGERFIVERLGLPAGNARRDGSALFDLAFANVAGSVKV